MPPRAPAAHRGRGKRRIDGAHRTDSLTPHRRRHRPSQYLAVRPFILRVTLATAPHRPRKRRLDAVSPPAPSPPRRRSVVPRHFLALRPFVLRYVLGLRRRKASVIDMGCFVSRLLGNTDDGGLRASTRHVKRSREEGDVSADMVQVETNAARRRIGDASDITMDEAWSYRPKEVAISISWVMA